MSLKAQIALPASPHQPLASDVVEQAAHLFRVHGTLMLENSFDRELIHSLQSDFLQNYAALDRSEVEKTCQKVGHERYMFTIRLQPPFLQPDVYASPRIMPIVKSLLGSDCILQSFGAVCAYPGATLQSVHRDYPPLFAEAGGLNAFLPPFALHVVVPLVDLDEHTGTTALWEGSHRVRSKAEEDRWTRDELNNLKGAVLPWPRMGDCYFMDFRLRHTGTPNNSSLPRPILYLVYSRRWFQDRRNYDLQEPLVISLEEHDRIPAEHEHLFLNARPDRAT